MGIGSFLLHAVNVFVTDVVAKIERYEEYKKKISELDDELLIKKYKTSTGDEKRACMEILKERGYGRKKTD